MTDNLIERKAFADFLLGNYSDVYTQENVDHYIEHGHVSWLAWQGRAAIERHSAPAGYVLVPIEPSEAMTDATYAGQHCSDIWRDMIAAAPQPQPVLSSPVPPEVVACLHAYGDSRADDDGLSGLRIAEAIVAVRRWAAAVKAAEHQPQPVQEPVAHSVLRQFALSRQWEIKWVDRPVAGPLYTSPQAAAPQPAQEPVAEVKARSDSIGGTFIQRYAELAPGTKLYTPPQSAQPLSDAQMAELPVWRHFVGLTPEHRVEIARAIKQAHGITEGTR